MLPDHLGSVGNSARLGHPGPSYGYKTSTKAPRVTKARHEHRVLTLPLASGTGLLRSCLWAKASDMAMSIFKEGNKGNLTMCPGHGCTKQYLASSTNDYQSLSGHKIFGLLSLPQAKYIHAPPPSRGENPKALSWPYHSPISFKMYGLWVMCDSL